MAHLPLSSQDCYLDFLIWPPNVAALLLLLVVVVVVVVPLGVRGLNDEYMNAMCS